MQTWRERFRPRIVMLIAGAQREARERGLDEKRAIRKALRCPYKGGWLAQVWYDECALHLGSPKGRIQSRSIAAKRARNTALAGTQASLFDV